MQQDIVLNMLTNKSTIQIWKKGNYNFINWDAILKIIIIFSAREYHIMFTYLHYLKSLKLFNEWYIFWCWSLPDEELPERELQLEWFLLVRASGNSNCSGYWTMTNISNSIRNCTKVFHSIYYQMIAMESTNARKSTQQE